MDNGNCNCTIGYTDMMCDKCDHGYYDANNENNNPLTCIGNYVIDNNLWINISSNWFKISD